MSAFYAVIGFIAVQRLAELAFAARNTRRLKSDGAVEVGARHYPLLIVLHVAWFVAIIATISPDKPVNLPLLGVFATLQVARFWVIATLGKRWTTRIIVPRNLPPVTNGPYRLVRHPNYLIVCGEIAVVPLMFGAWKIALFFSLLNLMILRHRVRVEKAAWGLGIRNI